MKRFCIFACILCLLLPAAAMAAASASAPAFDPALAQDALDIAGLCYLPSMQASILRIRGFEQTGVYHYDREDETMKHVASYCVYHRLAEDGHSRVIIAIRGTGEGEWALNMDLMPSGDYTQPEAENFALAAEEILSAQSAFFSTLESPEFLVTGHSRGAAVANVLGARLTDLYGAEHVLAYTFATPRTVRGNMPAYGNIFNIIHPADIVTFLPLPAWGFSRYGTDLILDVENAALYPAAEKAYLARSDAAGSFDMIQGDTKALKDTLAALEQFAPSVDMAYTVRHALTHPGPAQAGEDGITAADFLLMLMNGSSADLASLAQSENDFSQFLLIFQSGMPLITGVHLPASYGAWLSAMFPEADAALPQNQP